MGCYFIANIDVRDEAPVVLEGSWNYTKAVVIRFESRADFEAWYRSPDYAEILRYRLAAARSDAILVRDREPEIALERTDPTSTAG